MFYLFWWWIMPVILPCPVVDVGGIRAPQYKPEVVAMEQQESYTCPRCHYFTDHPDVVPSPGELVCRCSATELDEFWEARLA